MVILGNIAFFSIVEWVLHRFMMHRPFLGLKYAFKAHALTHHRIFKADETYHLKNDSDKKKIPMAWWNGPTLVLGFSLPTLLLPWYWSNLWLFPITLVVGAAYYLAYERLHWCMHLPKSRRVELSWIFKKLNGHHLLHHRYMNRNFNVVLPLADLLLFTLRLRSGICFPQPIHPAVPNVQPLAA